MSQNKNDLIIPKEALTKQIEEYIVFAGKSLMHEALKKAKRRKCKRCHRKDKLKVTPLHEDPHPLPSTLVLFCSRCHYHETLMKRDSDKKMKHYMDEIQKMIDRKMPAKQKDEDKVVKDQQLSKKMIKSRKKNKGNSKK